MLFVTFRSFPSSSLRFCVDVRNIPFGGDRAHRTGRGGTHDGLMDGWMDMMGWGGVNMLDFKKEEGCIGTQDGWRWNLSTQC